MKKLISTALAMVMALSLAAPFGTLVYAEELPQETALVEQDGATLETAGTMAGAPQGESMDESALQSAAVQNEATQQEVTAKEQPATMENAAQPDVVDQVGNLFAALPSVEELSGMSAEERQAVMQQVSEAINAYDALSVEDGEAFLAKYGALYTEVTENLMAALLSESGSDVSNLSLQPMPETRDVYLTLAGYTADQLKHFPVDSIPDLLTDALGNPIEVSDSYTGAWFYFISDEVDESHALGVGETVDLWDYDYTSADQIDVSYSMCLVLGNGKQMNDGNSHRYIVTVEISTMDTMYAYLYPAIDQKASLYIKSENPVFDTLGMSGISYTFYGSNYESGQTHKIWFSSNSSEELNRRGIRMDVYPMEKFLSYRDEGAPLDGAITDEVLGTGYADTYDTQITAENCKTAPNLWCIVFTRKDSGRVLGYMGLSFQVKKISATWQAHLSFFDGNAMTTLDDSTISNTSTSLSYTIDTAASGDGIKIRNLYNNVVGVPFTLAQEYALDEPYYLTLTKNDDIKAVYEGDFDSEAEATAAGATNITDKVFSDGTQGLPSGYQLTLGYSHYVTLVLQDGSAIPAYFYGSRVYGGNTDENMRNDVEPNFQITGVQNPAGKWIGYYIADMASGIQLDTYYRRDDRYDVGGYQMVLLDQTLSQEELKNLIPTFWTPEGVQVNSGGKVVSGETSLVNAVWSDTMANTVMYQVQVPGEKLRNYQVTFAVRQPEAKLLVAGPDERFVNLTADNNFVHDILVANIGGTDLTGVKVELKDAVHVKLDNYWTIGGQGNDTLPAFEDTYPYYEDTDEYGNEHKYWSNYATLDNIAKVRLLADGEGEISGTLVITAANGDRREIKLTGIAANPHIVSATLQDAVKFVPYSYMVVTDNMYKWNRSTFSLVDGQLPEGMQLYEATGEIYGTPTETGDFTFTVQVDYSSSRFSPSQATYTLHVANNTNVKVYEQSDEGYSIKVPLGVEQGEGTRDFYLADTSTDQLYVSNGVIEEFQNVWLNGQRLVYGRDYTAESGSTRITIRSQTFAAMAYQDRFNTIAVEFRVDGDRDNELKRTAQNFRLDPDLREELEEENGTENGNGASVGTSGSANSNTASATATAQPTNKAVDAGQVPENANGVTLRFHVKDGQGGPIVGATAELHSSPRYGTTDGEGCVTFANVEFGAHTLTIYDANGNMMGSKSFTLACGGFGIDGSVITVSDGGLVDINVKVENGTLQFDNVSLAQSAMTVPQTGDDFAPTLWVALAVLSVCAATGITIYQKKKVQR